MRGILDGHIVLDRSIAARGRFPAIDPRSSISRVMPSVVAPEHLAAATAVREHIAGYEEKRDLVLLGAYERGRDARLDRVLDRIDAIESFLAQPNMDEPEPLETIEARLRSLTA